MGHLAAQQIEAKPSFCNPGTRPTIDQDVIDANLDLIVSVFQRVGSQPGQLVTYYPRVALIENGGKLAIVKRDSKPRLVPLRS